MIVTSLNRIRACAPCTEGWTLHLRSTGKVAADDDVLSYAEIVQINSFDDALWAARAAPEHEALWRGFALWCADQAQGLAGAAAQRDAAKALRQARASDWTEAIWRTPALAARALGWAGFDRGEDFKTAQAQAMARFQQEFLSRVGG